MSLASKRSTEALLASSVCEHINCVSNATSSTNSGPSPTLIDKLVKLRIIKKIVKIIWKNKGIEGRIGRKEF